MTDEAPAGRGAEALRELIDTAIAPLLARDSASVELVSVEAGVVTLRPLGALRGCPGREWTARGVILPALQRVDPTISRVEFC